MGRKKRTNVSMTHTRDEYVNTNAVQLLLLTVAWLGLIPTTLPMGTGNNESTHKHVSTNQLYSKSKTERKTRNERERGREKQRAADDDDCGCNIL